MITDKDAVLVQQNGTDRYWFDDLIQKEMHDSVRDFYLHHAQCINEVIRPFIVNSVKKQRWTKGMGSDFYHLPLLMARMSTEEEQKENELPFHILQSEVVSPKTGECLQVSMKLGIVAEITSTDFAIFAELVKKKIATYKTDLLQENNEGIILNGR